MSNNKFLFKVKSTFLIHGRGLVLSPGLGENLVDNGSKIKLIRPDKSSIQTNIQAISFEGQHDILIDMSIEQNDVPVGTEVWLVE